jgi:carboxypeptidase Q
MTRARLISLLLITLMTHAVTGQTSTPTSDQATKDDPIARIKDEEFNHSELIKTLTYLTDVIGPRLTNSPNYRRASVWTRDQLTAWGLTNAHLEPWGPSGRGWEIKRFSAQVTEPQATPLIAYPLAWSPPTNGELVSEIVYIDAATEADLSKFKGQLKGKIVLLGNVRKVDAQFEPLARRWNDFDMLQYATDQPYPPDNPELAPPQPTNQLESRRFRDARLRFLLEEGAALLMMPSPGFDGGTLVVQAAEVPRPVSGNPIRAYSPEAKTLPQVIVSVEQYNRMVRMIQAGEKLKAAADLAVQFYDRDLMSSHTIAEIPGGDLKDEVVMMGAHLDSWHSGTGATDNGAGVAVMMEAARIIQSLQLKPRRTIRVALWGGEENFGGSSYYVSKHFGHWQTSPDKKRTLIKEPEYDRLSAYLNLDAGTGKVRGVFLAHNEALRSVFRPWLEPLRSMGVTTLTTNGDWGSDFLFFDNIGIPIVSFIQDEIEYETRTHHTNEDVFDRIQADDLKQATVVVAAFAYQIAMLDQQLPHKPM